MSNDWGNWVRPHKKVPRISRDGRRGSRFTRTTSAQSDSNGEPIEVLLINMPFGPLRQPSLGLSLLKSSLTHVRSKVLYLSLFFSDWIGPALYQWMSDSPYGSALVGEWIFSGALFESTDSKVEEYIERVLRRPLSHDPQAKRIIRDILAVREMTGDFLDECLEMVIKTGPDGRLQDGGPRIVGFTSVFQQQVASLALAKRVKARSPDVFVAFGGANCEGAMGREVVRQFPFVDAVVSGEGDLVFSNLVDRVLSGRSFSELTGVHSRDELARGDTATTLRNAPSVLRMDSLPYPDYQDYFHQWHASKASRTLQPRLLIETSRGCWWGEKHHCTFCGLNGSTMAFRSKSPDRALDELEYLARRHPGLKTMVVDNILDPGYFKDFIPELAKRDLKTKLFYEVKSNLTKEQVRLLRSAGVTEILPGIESLSDSVLRLMDKGVTGLQNIQLLKWCAELGLWPTWYFIWGFPGEDPREYERMAEMIPLLTHLPPPRVGTQIRLDRFSPNFDRAEELGFTDVRPFAAYNYIYPIDPEAIANLAYFFAYEYREPRDVSSYADKLAKRIADWQSAYAESELFYSDNGEELWLWDLRPARSQKLAVLVNVQRSIYLECDRARSVKWLSQESRRITGEALSCGEIEEIVSPMVEQGFMIEERAYVLSLATARSDPGTEAIDRGVDIVAEALPQFVQLERPGSKREAPANTASRITRRDSAGSVDPL